MNCCKNYGGTDGPVNKPREEEQLQTRPRLLLHVCCGPCATHSIEALRRDYELTLFYSNSNIWPREEYARRLTETRRLAGILDVPLIVDSYEHDDWRRSITGLEHEPEGGARCERCFAHNLARAARYAVENNFDWFTTTLTISPHKKSQVIFDVGRRLGPFLAVDLKKKDGFRRSLELSRKWNLYRQNYCGCEFSLRVSRDKKLIISCSAKVGGIS